jgi:uncharacterized damage-inducible protein DinB
MHQRPDPSEYNAYYAPYVDALPDGDIVRILEAEMHRTLALLASVPPELETRRYAPGKWSVREVMGHIADAERVFGLRALTFARGDAGPLPAFDEKRWAEVSNAHDRPLPELAAEFEALRRSHLLLARSLDGEMLLREGIASGNPVTVRALLWIMAGHERHHRSILEDRYLGGT